MSETYKFKLILFGNEFVGKTSIVNRYINDKYESEYVSTLGYNVYEKIVDIEGSNVNFLIFDIGGQEKFRDLRKKYANGAKAALLVYDITSQASFDNIVNWYNDLIEFTNNSYFILVGNKVDLEDIRQITKEEGEKLAKDLGALGFYETSAKNNIMIDEAFYIFAKNMINQKKLQV